MWVQYVLSNYFYTSMSKYHIPYNYYVYIGTHEISVLSVYLRGQTYHCEILLLLIKYFYNTKIFKYYNFFRECIIEIKNGHE